MGRFIRILSLIVFGIATMSTSSSAIAGKLGDFEAVVKNQKQSSNKGDKSTQPESSITSLKEIEYDEQGCVVEDEDLDDFLFHLISFGLFLPDENNLDSSGCPQSTMDSLMDELLIGVTHPFILGGGEATEYISDGGRQDGDSLLPYSHINFNFHSVSEDISGTDIQFELGKGSNAVNVRFTRFSDGKTDEQLDFFQATYLYRMLFWERLGVNLGIGTGRMKGVDSYSGAVLTLPVLLRVSENWTIVSRFTSQSADQAEISDTDISILYSYRKAGIRIGHRELEVDDVSIEGVYVGFDFIY